MTAYYLTFKRKLGVLKSYTGLSNITYDALRYLLKISILLFLLIISKKSFSQAPAWGVPPKNWDDFYVGLVNDFKKPNTVNETGFWLDVINTANNTGVYTAADTRKKSVLYQYKYLNPSADTSTNWYQQQVITGLRLIDHMRMDGEAVGVRNAWVVYMLQGNDGEAAEAKLHLQDAAYMEKFFWNLKYVAQKSNGNKSVFVIEPDTWGYIIKAIHGGDASFSPSMLAYAGQVATNNPAQFGYLAGLPNTLAGVCQGIVRTIRTYAPDAYVGFHVNTWTSLDPAPSKPVFGCPGCVGGRSGLPWRTTAEIDWTVTSQLNFYNGLFPANGDKGDFMVLEKYGANAGFIGGNEYFWDATAMQNWLRFAKGMGQGFCRPMIMWQIQLGQSNAASAALGVGNLPNTSGRYQDTFVEYMFNNFNQFLDAGFIGFLGGKGIANQTDFSNQNGYGDNGYFFKGLNTYINPGRPYNLIRGVPQPDLGNDTTLCGTGGSLVLNPGSAAGSTILWSTGATTPTLTVSAPGTYWVRFTSGTVCGKSDTVVVSNTYSVNLGLNATLCNPSSKTLDAGHQGTGVTYVWERNATVITGETTRFLFVNLPGTYKVTVTDPSCLPAKTHSVTFTANPVVPTASSFCFSSPGAANLSVVNSGGTYNWYATPTSTGVLQTGTSYTTPTISAATTYYVADVKVNASTIMPKLVADGYTNPMNSGSVGGTDWLYFNAQVPFTLQRLTIEGNVSWCGGTRQGGIAITNTSTGYSFDSGLLTFPCSGTGWQPLTITLAGGGVMIPKATGYAIRYYSAEAPMNVYRGVSGTGVYPRNYNNIMVTTGYNHGNASTALFGHPAMYDFVVTAPSTCDRTPVLAVPCAALPLSWISVSAEYTDGVVQVEWTAVEDEYLSHYVVERSYDGISFTPISGNINAQHSLASYRAYDEHAANGTIYYHVVAYDVDGTIYHSNTVTVSSSESEIGIYPSPSLVSQQLFLKGNPTIEYSINVFNSNGQALNAAPLLVKGGGEISTQEMRSAGMYILEISTGAEVVHWRVVVSGQ